METLILVKIDTEYCNYLRKFDKKIMYNAGAKEIRPFVGVLFKVKDCMYFAPLSSPKAKHKKIKSKLDFLKLDNGNLGAINFNNMIPVMERNVVKLNLKKKAKTNKEEKYLKLLKEQLFWLNRNDQRIYNRAEKLYNKYLNNTLELNIRKRCCNFLLLEEKCKEYNINR